MSGYYRGAARAIPIALACALVSACGDGGDGGSNGGTSTTSPATTATDAAATQRTREIDAVRLAKQASFGPTPDLVNHILAIGTSAWIDEQFAATGSTYADIAANSVASDICGTDGVCNRHNFTREPVAMRFYANALSQPDQLRQRVAFALSQLMVASDIETASAAGLASLNQIFLSNAFGNFRDILMAVTLNGTMGEYLDMADSNKTAPSENYAREMLQLFSIGPDKLNMDGTLVTDATGTAIPNYGPDDIRGVARALTGWTYDRLNGAAITVSTQRDRSRPMIPVAARYDTTAKSFLGVTVAANASQADSVAGVVDAAFNNASTPPYVAKYLIRHLVTANPSAAYIGRIAAVFANNGSNVRGDMKAVVRAILTDAEARGTPAGDTIGKVKEPVLLMTALARAAGMVSDGYALEVRDTGLGQPIFHSPSVFNFYPPDYPLPQSSTLVSPASKLMTMPLVVARHNLVYDWTIGALTTRTEFAAQASVTGSTGTSIDWSSWEALDIDAMIDRMDLILMNRMMTSAQKAALRSTANAVTNSVAATQARARAQMMLYAVMTSPLFQVDR